MSFNYSAIKKLPSYMPWLIWGLACMFYFYESLLQMSLSVIGTELMRDFSVTSKTLGFLAGIYFYSYAFMQIPGGMMMDYFGPQRLISLAALICGISTIAFGLTNSFFTACLARLMIGFGSAAAAVGCMKIASCWFKPDRFPILTGLMVTIGMLGAIGGEGPLAIMIEHLGWRTSMLVMGAVGVLLAISIRLFAKDAPSSRMQYAKKDEPPLLSSLLTLMKQKQLWLVAVYGGLMYLSTPVFCGLWGVPFLMKKMHLSTTVAANNVSLIFVGWAVAGPLWGIFSNKLGLRKPPLFIASLGTLVLSLSFIFLPINSLVILAIIMFLFGVFSSAFLPAFTVVVELCNRRYAATALSFMNMMNMIGIALAQPTIGCILDYMWRGEMENSVRVYSLTAYSAALSLLPICILISLLILPFIKETYCRNV
ncbi:MAG: MFS transporter [Legionellales bacterium RIFCSPHIGHO2_12_FULL_37_14]|nr:MAG: MFS transporter [Legionellales bacterium RIFCSPHIGHO2_12_FULL_37_14]